MKLTGRVTSNDGEIAYVEMSDGARVHIFREEAGVARETFLEELPVGEINPNFDVFYAIETADGEIKRVSPTVN